jgi:Ca-activated chloride channel family protein
MTFLAPQFLPLLAIAPALAAMMLWAVWARRRAVARFYGRGPDRAWAPMPSIARGILSAVSWSLGVACVCLALARPAHSPVPRKVERSGRDVVFVIDVSRSMLAQDLKPSRLERAKLMVSDVLDAAEGDRVGIVAFAGTAVVRCPMTTDYSFARMSLEAISPDSVGRGGTAIGDALRSALALIRAGQEDQALAADIYLLTDGEDHETRPIEAAQEAGQLGVRLVAIGLGSDIGAPVPIAQEQAASAPRAQSRDAYMQFGGERVQSRMNPAVLRAMSEATLGGVFLDVGVGNLELDRVYRLLRREGQKKQLEATEAVRYTEAFQFPLGIALVLGISAMLINGISFRTRRSAGSASAAAAAAIVLAFCALPARAQSVADDVREGMQLLESGQAGEALGLMEGATLRHPDSAAVALARGCAHLSLSQAAEAEAAFRRAEQLALGRDDAIASRARFNLGLLDAARAAEEVQFDPKAAIKSLEQAERWFRNARSGLRDDERAAAAANIESIQRAREALRRKIAEQEKQNQQQQQQQSGSQSDDAGQSGDGQQGKSDQPSGSPQDQPQGEQSPQSSPEQKSAEDLAELARQQEQAAADSQQAQQQQGQTPQQQQEHAQKLAQDQRQLSEQSGKLDEQLARQQAEAKAREQQAQGEEAEARKQQRENLERSREKLDEARQAQARAEEQLRRGDTQAAEQAQREAAEKLKDAARAALGIDQQQGEGEPQEQPQEQQAQEQQGKDGQRAFDATAANILDREARQREAIRRFLKSQQRTRTPPVEKDW